MEKDSKQHKHAKAPMVWNPGLYDGKLGMVSELGAGALDWLDPRPGERILDLGCGTGDLARVIADRGATIAGMDASPEMIHAARDKFPELTFFTGDGQSFRVQGEVYDAVFSNAALHWMPDAGGVAESVRNALRPGGRFVAEFGGKGNAAAVIRAVQKVLSRRYGIMAGTESGPWYFPSIGEYASLLESSGFRVERAVHFDRPTPMKDGIEGLRHWLDSFGRMLLAPVPEEEREEVYQEIRSLAEEALFREGQWVIDYVRLRISAVRTD